MESRYYKLIIPALLALGCSDSSVNKETLFTRLDSDQTGIEFSNDLVETKENNHLTNDMIISGGGVATGDLNNDGLPDIVFAGNQVGDAVYINKGNMVFQDITKSSGITEETKRWSTGVSLVDINKDGFLDIYICKNVQENIQAGANKLYINNGDLTFSEKASEYGLADRGFSIHASFFDYDLDGDLDVYVVNQPPSLGNRTSKVHQTLNKETSDYTDRLYENREGLFHDVTIESGLMSFGYGFIALIGDLNGDHWPDIYVPNDYNRGDFLYINQRNGRFRDNINQRVKHIPNFSMGGDLADYNNDGLLDIMVVDMVAEDHKRIKTNMSGMNPNNFWNIVHYGWHYQYMFNALQKNNGNGTFSELAHLGGVSNSDWSWGPIFADFDKDGYKDLFITNGVIRNSRYTDLQKKVSRKLDSLEAIANRRDVPLNDLIDVMDFVNMTPTDELQNFVFRNNQDLTFEKVSDEWGFAEKDLSNGVAYADFDLDGDLDLVTNNVNQEASLYQNNMNDKSWLTIDLVPNESVLPGTKVKVYLEDESIQYYEVTLSRGYMSQSMTQPFFGLDDKKVDSIRIRWNSGKITTIKEGVMEGVIRATEDEAKLPTGGTMSSPIFKQHSVSDYRHKENNFDDYLHQILLPYKQSNQGPLISVTDINKDGLDDFYVGGPANKPGMFFYQRRDGTFNEVKFQVDSSYEDVGSVFVDYDNDGDDDLYIVSGGNEFEHNSDMYQDRLYENVGRGVFRRDTLSLPKFNISGSKVIAEDYDKDGDKDLLVLGRQIPRRYPLPVSSKILRNDNGKFVDATDEVASELNDIGLMNDAVWIDYDNDDDLDFIAVGEWTSIMVFQQDNGVFQRTSTALDSLSGWYFNIHADDMDGDGDKDLLIGNLGLNAKYKATNETPFEVFGGDIDENGHYDIVLAYNVGNEKFPVRGRSCSSDQIPEIAQNFPSYEKFSEANIIDLFGEVIVEHPHYVATTFATMYLENRSGEFFAKPLPNEAQTSVVNSFITEDFDGDGLKDILLAGNLYPVEIETPRFDAGMGLYLKGNGKGDFIPTSLQESGFFAPLDVRDMALLKTRNKSMIVVSNNQEKLQFFTVL